MEGVSMVGEEALIRKCVECDRPLPDDANVCPHCGRDYRPAMMGRAWEWENTPLPPIGGALVALSSVALILSGLLWVFEGFPDASDAWDTNRTMTTLMGLSAVAAGAFAISVSPFIMTRRRLALSLAGSIAALGAWGVVIAYALGGIISILSLVGLILIAISRDEFTD